MTWSKEKISQYLFYLLVFLLPWQTRWIITDPPLFGGVWEYGRLSLYGWDIVLAVLAVLTAPQLWRECKLMLGRSPGFRVFVLLAALAYLTGAWAAEPLLSTYWGLRLVEGGVLWLLVRVVRPRFSVVCWSLAAAGALQAAWGVAQFATQDTLQH